MPTLAELKVRAKQYGLIGYSKLRKRELTEKIILTRIAEEEKRLQRAWSTGRFHTLREDIFNPLKQEQVQRELRQLEAEASASLRAKALEKKNPRAKAKLLRLAGKKKRRQKLIKLIADTLRRDPEIFRRPTFDLDNRVPWPVQLPIDDWENLLWIMVLARAKDEFKVDGAVAVYSTWKAQTGDTNKGEKIKVLDATMKDDRAARLLEVIPEGEFLLKIKFIALEGDKDRSYVIKDKRDPIRTEEKKKRRVVVISRTTKPDVLTGIDKPYYKHAYPQTAVVYGLYPIREPDLANLPPMRDGDFNCVAQRVMEHFESAKRGPGLTEKRRQKIQEWEGGVHDIGATVDEVSKLEKILKRAIILRDIAGEYLYNSGKYQASRWEPIELICHNGHTWSKDLHFPRVRTVHLYDGDVWEAIQQALQGRPTAVWLGGDQGRQPDQFTLEDGSMYRTQEIHEKLQKVCSAFGDESLADRVFSENHAAWVVTKERNGWKTTPGRFLEDIQKACVDHGHGGLWNAMGYDIEDIVSIDMKACYPASFQGMGEAKPYFERFGHPRHRMSRVSINGPLPEDIGTGFAEVQEWQFQDCHPVISAWFGKHFAEKGWAPTQLLVFLVNSGILINLKVREAIVAFEKQTEVWLPEDRTQGCIIIGKFTQGSKTDCKSLTRRLVTNQGELDFLVRDTRLSGTLVGTSKCPLGHILAYFDAPQPQYTHLRASMLAYAHINLITMLQRFSPDEAVRVATDSIYLQKTALHKLEGVEAYMPPGSFLPTKRRPELSSPKRRPKRPELRRLSGHPPITWRNITPIQIGSTPLPICICSICSGVSVPRRLSGYATPILHAERPDSMRLTTIPSSASRLIWRFPRHTMPSTCSVCFSASAQRWPSEWPSTLHLQCSWRLGTENEVSSVSISTSSSERMRMCP